MTNYITQIYMFQQKILQMYRFNINKIFFAYFLVIIITSYKYTSNKATNV